MYEYEDADDLLQQFYPSMYDELSEAANGHYPREPVWDAVAPSEELIIRDHDADLADGLDQYVDALDPIKDQYVWIAENNREVRDSLPAASRNRPNMNVCLYVYRDGMTRQITFLDYVNEYAEEFMDDDADAPFRDRMADAVDDWKTQFADQHNDWYGHVMAATNIGSPSLLRILRDTEEGRMQLQMCIGELLPAVESRVLAMTDSTNTVNLQDTPDYGS